jgi:HSP20 family protein
MGAAPARGAGSQEPEPEEGTMLTTRRALTPSADLFANFRRLNRLMDETLGWQGEPGDTFTSAWLPAVDIVENGDHVKLVVEVPGVNPEDVKIGLENNVLTIRGEKRQVKEEKDDRWHRYERTYGSFERSFTLPSTVDADRIEATADNGVLTITMVKSERSRPKEIPVRTTAAQARIETPKSR